MGLLLFHLLKSSFKAQRRNVHSGTRDPKQGVGREVPVGILDSAPGTMLLSAVCLYKVGEGAREKVQGADETHCLEEKQPRLRACVVPG